VTKFFFKLSFARIGQNLVDRVFRAWAFRRGREGDNARHFSRGRSKFLIVGPNGMKFGRLGILEVGLAIVILF
jgi:hypothetical protein